jgi:FixJ family two-component response regulator
MSQQTGDKAVVHIVDDDESLRCAVDSLCRSVGFQTRAYG